MNDISGIGIGDIGLIGRIVIDPNIMRRSVESGNVWGLVGGLLIINTQ